MQDKTNLLVYYKFDESGVTHVDYSSNHNYFVYSSYLPGTEIPSSSNFMEEGSYYNTSLVLSPGYTNNDLGVAFAGPSLTNEITVELWAIFSSIQGAFQPIIGVQNRAIGCGFEIVYNVSGQSLWCSWDPVYQANPILSAAYTFTPNVWNYFSCVCSKTNSYMQLLVNANPLQTIPFVDYGSSKKYFSHGLANSFYYGSGAYVIVGRRSVLMSDVFNGNAKQIRFWSAPLQQFQLMQLMHQYRSILIYRKVDTFPYINLVSAWSLNDVGKFLYDEGIVNSATMNPYTYFSGQYNSVQNNIYYSPAPSAYPSLVICRNGSIYDPTQNKCILGSEIFLHFVGGDPESYSYSYTPGVYTSHSVEAWVFPEHLVGEQYIFVHQGYEYFGISSTSIFSIFPNVGFRYDLPYSIQQFAWLHVSYRLYLGGGTYRITV